MIFAALCLAVILLLHSLLFLGLRDSAAIIAASLAVIAALVSAWTGQRVLELQEDAQKPYPYPSIDANSRYSLMQLRVTNYGGSVARDINLSWDNNNPLLNADDVPVKFSDQDDAPDIAVLLPEQSAALLIGGDEQTFNERKGLNYSGKVKFKTASGKLMEHTFYLSPEQYRNTLVYDEEQPKTHYQLQKIPEELKRLREEIKWFGKH
jgi:hypothetical protein